jgi:hypothetical protein
MSVILIRVESELIGSDQAEACYRSNVSRKLRVNERSSRGSERSMYRRLIRGIQAVAWEAVGILVAES